MKIVGGWYIRDEEIELSPRYVMKVIEVTSDPRSDYYDLMRQEAVPADELMGRRWRPACSRSSPSCGRKRNWHRIMREWLFADPPSTELGEEEWAYFEERGTSQAARPRREARS